VLFIGKIELLLTGLSRKILKYKNTGLPATVKNPHLINFLP
jgi:hypothetical protein